jgi:glycosyltransferase involved in cell wall biosynthesis
VFLAERWGVRSLARWALRRAGLLTGCSGELVARVEALGFPAERSRVIPYGVDTVRFSPDTPGARRRGLWRQRLGVPEAAPLLLSVGRMVAKKGFDVLAGELPALLGAHPDLHVVLAGDGDLLPGLRRTTAAWKERVHLPGAVLRDTLPDLYRAADVFVLPAVHDRRGNVDGLPNVILEAMASGLPVVASGISGIPLAVEHEVTGLLVPERDGAALGAALARLLGGAGGVGGAGGRGRVGGAGGVGGAAIGRGSDSGSEARRMGEKGRRKAEIELTWDAIARRHREAYSQAIAADRRGRYVIPQ